LPNLETPYHTIQYIKDPTTLATKSTGRKEGRKVRVSLSKKVQLGFGGL
jgi:hypothetical protein